MSVVLLIAFFHGMMLADHFPARRRGWRALAGLAVAAAAVAALLHFRAYERDGHGSTIDPPGAVLLVAAVVLTGFRLGRLVPPPGDP